LGTGTDTISGVSTLEFGAGVGTAATLGDQDIGFTGGGTLHLLAPTTFYGEISSFAAGDTVELKGSWAYSSISEAGGLTTLTLESGATTHGSSLSATIPRATSPSRRERPRKSPTPDARLRGLNVNGRPRPFRPRAGNGGGRARKRRAARHGRPTTRSFASSCLARASASAWKSATPCYIVSAI
jgi:hypothetical protein